MGKGGIHYIYLQVPKLRKRWTCEVEEHVKYEIVYDCSYIDALTKKTKKRFKLGLRGTRGFNSNKNIEDVNKQKSCSSNLLTYKRTRCAPVLDLHSVMSVGINAKGFSKYSRGHFSF